MSIYNRYGSYCECDYQPRPSTRIYALRREGRIDEARRLAEMLIREGEADDDVWKAYAWTLIDICKKCIDNGEITNARVHVDYLENLSKRKFESEVSQDKYTEALVKKINSLSFSVNPYADQIQEAKSLSQSGNNDSAWEILVQLSSGGNLPIAAHETYGWVIYRYLRDHYKTMTSEQVRGILRDYIVLKNKRPSALHSQILSFASYYSMEDTKFKFLNFFKLWGPNCIRNDDCFDSMGKDGKKVPSLMSRIARAIMDYSPSDIQDFADLMGDYQETFIERLKEQFFWKIYHSIEDNLSTVTWELFDQYLDFYPETPSSTSHSKVLYLAERVMKDDNLYRFYGFFKKWNPEKFCQEDWQEEKGKKDETYKPLALKSIKKAKEALNFLTDDQIGDLQWLIDIYGVAISKFPDDDWNIRSKALLHLKAGQIDNAKAIYMELCLKMGEKYYIWQEFADCWDDPEVKIALLCKAISLEKNEDFIGKIRLELAKQLISVGRLENAAVELNLYKNHYAQKGWRISTEENSLQLKCNTVVANSSNNDALYAEYIPKAEDYAFADIAYTEVVLVDKWTNDDGKDLLAFTDGNSIEFVINKNRFPVLRKSHKGQVWRMKLYKDETVAKFCAANHWLPTKNEVRVKYIPLIVKFSDKEDWGALPISYGYIQHVNTEKKVYHIYSVDSELAFEHYEQQELTVGNFVSLRQYKRRVKEDIKMFFCDIQKCSQEEAFDKFKSRIVAVDEVNASKQLFHFVLGHNYISGILRYDQTSLRPSVGDCIKIYYFVRKIDDKKCPGYQKKVVEVVKSESTDEVNGDIVKNISGYLELKYRGENEYGEPDFAFVGDYYVHKSILRKYSINTDCHIKGRAIYVGDGKWKVFEIEKVIESSLQ